MTDLNDEKYTEDDPESLAQEAYEREMESRLAFEEDHEWRVQIDQILQTCDEIQATIQRVKRFLLVG